MSETAISKSGRRATADYKALIAQAVDEMRRLEEQMNQNQATNDRLDAEIRVIKAETRLIQARTAAALPQLVRQIDNLARTV